MLESSVGKKREKRCTIPRLVVGRPQLETSGHGKDGTDSEQVQLSVLNGYSDDVVASNHYHLILTPDDVDQLADFMDYVQPPVMWNWLRRVPQTPVDWDRDWT